MSGHKNNHRHLYRFSIGEIQRRKNLSNGGGDNRRAVREYAAGTMPGTMRKRGPLGLEKESPRFVRGVGRSTIQQAIGYGGGGVLSECGHIQWQNAGCHGHAWMNVGISSRIGRGHACLQGTTVFVTPTCSRKRGHGTRHQSSVGQRIRRHRRRWPHSTQR